MVKHAKTILWQQPVNCLSVFDHFVGLLLKWRVCRNLYFSNLVKNMSTSKQTIDNPDSGNSRPLEILDKAKFFHWKFCKIVLHPLEIPKPKTKIIGNNKRFFVDYHSILFLTSANSTCYILHT